MLLPKRRCPNMGELDEVLPGMYIGGEAEAWDQNLLGALGVTHVVNCAKNVNNAFPSSFCYLHLRLTDDPTEHILDHFTHTNQYS